MNKKKYEDEIKKLTKEILPEKEMIEIKSIQTNKDAEETKELVTNNYSNDFLMELPKDGSNVVLAMGINPGGGDEVVRREFPTKDSILFTANLSDELKNNLKLFNNVYIYTKNYHKANYELFENIYAKAHWAMDGYLSEDEIKNMISNSIKVNKKVKYDEKTIIDTIKEMQKIERNKEKHEYKKDVFVLFGDLFWYADGKQKNISYIVNNKMQNKEECKIIYEKIRKIIDKNIEYYKPKLIVITNSYASHLVCESLGGNYKEDEYLIYDNNDIKVPILFGSMVSGRSPMDDFSKIRLKKQIKKLYKE